MNGWAARAVTEIRMAPTALAWREQGSRLSRRLPDIRGVWEGLGSGFGA